MGLYMIGYFTIFLAVIGHGLDLQETQSSISKLLKHNLSVMLLVVNCGVKCFMLYTCCDQCYILEDHPRDGAGRSAGLTWAA